MSLKAHAHWLIGIGPELRGRFATQVGHTLFEHAKILIGLHPKCFQNQILGQPRFPVLGSVFLGGAVLVTGRSGLVLPGSEAASPADLVSSVGMSS